MELKGENMELKQVNIGNGHPMWNHFVNQKWTQVLIIDKEKNEVISHFFGLNAKLYAIHFIATMKMENHYV